MNVTQEILSVLNVHGWAAQVKSGVSSPTHVELLVTEEQAREWLAAIRRALDRFGEGRARHT
jgi:hypothetical protein